MSKQQPLVVSDLTMKKTCPDSQIWFPHLTPATLRSLVKY